MCADAARTASYDRLLDGKIAQMVFTDPPYNVPIDGHVCGRGRARHGEFAMAAGEMSEAEFTAFLKTVLRQLALHSRDGALHFVCMDWRHLFELLTAGRGVYEELKNLCVWNKTNGGLGSLYRSKHELVVVFKAGRTSTTLRWGRTGATAPMCGTMPASTPSGRTATQSWPCIRRSSPVALVEDAILDCSRRGGIVLDAFCGSGTTLIAAERAGPAGLRPRA